MSELHAKDVKVFDDLVGHTLKKELYKFGGDSIWQYGWRSNINVDKFYFWHAHFAGRGINSRDSCLDELNSRADLWPICELWKLLESTVLSGHVPLRIYANAHTYGTEGYCHIDNLDDENYYSTIFYAHAEWHINWGGELLFFDNSGEVMRSVAAKPARIVSFPGSMLHKVASPSRACTSLRVSYVFKTQLVEGA